LPFSRTTISGAVSGRKSDEWVAFISVREPSNSRTNSHGVVLSQRSGCARHAGGGQIADDAMRSDPITDPGAFGERVERNSGEYWTAIEHVAGATRILAGPDGPSSSG